MLKYPDSLQENGVLAFKSAIWFWMMPQCPKPSCHQVMHDQWLHDSAYSSSKMYYKGFAHANNIINGGLECRSYSSSAFTQKVVLRSKLYKYYLGIMGFSSSGISKEDSLGYSTLCYSSSSNAMQDYVNCKVVNSYRGSFGIDTQRVCGSKVWIDGKTYSKNTKTTKFNIVKGDKNGNDSLVILDLTIKPISRNTDYQTACHSFTWIDGKTYKASNDSALYCITGGAANGCDSIVKLKLTILPIAFGIDSHSTCNSFTWIDGKTYTVSNDSATFRITSGASNGCDSIVKLKLTILPIATGIDSQIACKFLTWIDGKTYTKNNDSATYRILGGAVNGCDSMVRLNLTINTIDVSVIQDSLVLTASSKADTYQWVDCKNGFTPINGETNQSFNVKLNGSYAVIVTKNDCVDTSDCYTIANLGNNKINPSAYLVVYPNPTKDIFLVNFSGTSKKFYFITDITGKNIHSDYLNHGINAIPLENELVGVYFLNVGGNSIKILKQH